MKVKPKNWDDLFSALKARLLDRDVEIDWSHVPDFPPPMSIDEIVAAQPMTGPVRGKWKFVESKECAKVPKRHLN